MKPSLLWLIMNVMFGVSYAYAVDYDQSFELTSALNGSTFSGLDGLDESVSGAADKVVGRLDTYWNLYVYPTDLTQLNVRYGLSVQGNLYRTGVGQHFSQTSAANYRIDDLTPRLIGRPQDEFQLYQQLDKLALTWYSPYGDFVLGRQPISFGIAKVFSPIDVIQPMDLYAIDTSYRPGVDAIRGTWPLNAMSELDAGLVVGEDHAVFGRLKTNVKSFDVEIISITINGDNSILSFGLQSAIGQFGVWQESALMFEHNDTALRSTIGSDITVLDDLYLMAEVHYNGLGANENYLTNASSESFYKLGTVVPLAQWYGSVQASYPINILTQLTTGATLNMNDGSALVNTAINISATDYLTIDASLVMPLSKAHTVDREYGMYPVYLNIEFGWVF